MKVGHARWATHAAQAAAVCATIALASCKRPAVETSTRSASAPAPAEQLAAGEEVYQTGCANCHYAGEASATTPALVGSAAVGGEPGALFKIILQGQRNESVVEGRKLNGIMPAMAYLSDEEIAAVTAYVRQRFAGRAEAIDPAQVAAERKKLGVD
jgi:mono/diheme cytochrome c family protein